MRFRLVVRGHLPPDKRGTADDKHRIRRELHPQLRNMWATHPILETLGGSPGRVESLAEEHERWGSGLYR
jgi:hypothetical protein